MHLAPWTTVTQRTGIAEPPTHGQGAARRRCRHGPPNPPPTTDALQGVLEGEVHLRGRASTSTTGRPPAAAAASTISQRDTSFHTSPNPPPTTEVLADNLAGGVNLHDGVGCTNCTDSPGPPAVELVHPPSAPARATKVLANHLAWEVRLHDEGLTHQQVHEGHNIHGIHSASQVARGRVHTPPAPNQTTKALAGDIVTVVRQHVGELVAQVLINGARVADSCSLTFTRLAMRPHDEMTVHYLHVVRASAVIQSTVSVPGHG